jgi:type IV secretion system protein VirB9
MKRLVLACAGAAAFAAAAPLAAQVRPHPGAGDPHIQTIEYNAEQVVELQGAPGYEMTIELAPDEQVENVAVGDSSAWQVVASHRGDHLFVKAVAGGVATNMTVVTNVRLYAFLLTPLPGPGADSAYTIRFHYPSAAQALAEDGPAGAAQGRYRLSGEKALRPSAISDDGRRTYIQWPREATLPAVYALDGGQETLVNGMMRDDVFVIDSIAADLVFRIDRRSARARRVAGGKGKG